MSKSCPHCGRTNRATAHFCAYCATEMVQHCHICNAENPSSARFCHHCATVLTGHTVYTTGTGLLIPSTVLAGRYRVILRVGQGGMGAVYKATDTRLGNKVVAVKEMSEADLTSPLERQQARQAFEQEAQMLADLDHVNLPRVTDYFSENGKQYLVMDFIHGQTLLDLLEQTGRPLEVEKVVEWGKNLCQVLEYLHSQQPPIIFRDLKPTNIMLDRRGQIKLIDFGIVRLFKKGQPTDTTSFGTTGYSPPEQHGPGQTDFRSDIYALGATLHHLLTYRNPKQAPFHFPSIRQFNRNVSKGLDHAIMKAVAPEPAMRWQTMRQMRDALVGATLIQPKPSRTNGSIGPTRRYPSQQKPKTKSKPPIIISQTSPHAATRKWPDKKTPPAATPNKKSQKRAKKKKKSPPPARPTAAKTPRAATPPTRRGSIRPQSRQAKAASVKKNANNTTKPTKKSGSSFSLPTIKWPSLHLMDIRSYFTKIMVTALIFSLAKLIVFHIINLPIPLGAALWWMAAPLAYMLVRQPGAAFLTHTLDYLSYVWLIGAFAGPQLIWLVPGAIIDLFLGRDGYQNATYQKVVGACLLASVVSVILLLIYGWNGTLYGLLLQLGGAFLGSSMAYLIGQMIAKSNTFNSTN